MMISRSGAPRAHARVLLWVRRLLAFVALAVVTLGVALIVILPRATHGVAMTVLTGSMTPTIPVGSLVIVEPVDPGTLRVGDIATYQPQAGKPTYITHRITKIETSKGQTSFTFKGDANRSADIFPVSAKQIRGKVRFHFAYLGAIKDLLHTRNGLTGLAMLVLVGYGCTQLAGGLRARAPRSAVHVADPPQVPGAYTTGDEHQVVLLAVLPLVELEGLSPSAIAKLLGAMVLDEDLATVTLLLAEPARRAEETVTLLEQFSPVMLQVSGPVATGVVVADTDQDPVRVEEHV